MFNAGRVDGHAPWNQWNTLPVWNAVQVGAAMASGVMAIQSKSWREGAGPHPPLQAQAVAIAIAVLYASLPRAHANHQPRSAYWTNWTAGTGQQRGAVAGRGHAAAGLHSCRVRRGLATPRRSPSQSRRRADVPPSMWPGVLVRAAAWSSYVEILQ